MKFGELNNEKRIYDNKFIEPVKFLPVRFRSPASLRSRGSETVDIESDSEALLQAVRLVK
ncbi:MAG: hypothetical protein RLZZ29_1421 [Cyanobacteriota bacterium]|jgi:hypothetical protein